MNFRCESYLLVLHSHQRTPRMILCFEKLIAGRSSAPPCDSRKLLLKRRAGNCRRAAVRGVTDDAALVAEKPALAALSYVCRLSHNRVGLETSASANCRGCRGANVGEEIAALRRRCRCCTGQQWVNQ